MQLYCTEKKVTDHYTTPVLRLLQSAEAIKARLAGEFSAIHGLSVNEVFLLMQLERAEQNKLPRVELARRLHMSASTVTRMAAPLEKLGLVTKQADERDARLAFVVLTETGKTRIQETRASFAKQATFLFRDRWLDDEVDQLSELLGRFVADKPGSLT